jgi:hypothetical protein
MNEKVVTLPVVRIERESSSVSMTREAVAEVLDFLNSIEGAGYGGMSSFEIARQHVRHAVDTGD